MNAQQIRWARQHDWFRHESGNGYIWVYDSCTDCNIKFSNFQALKDWAGY